MRKKVLALVLALVMVVAMLPTVAFAAAEDYSYQTVLGSDGYEMKGDVITLTKDYSGSKYIKFTEGTNTIDLAGKHFAVGGMAFQVTGTGTKLTIKDSQNTSNIVNNSVTHNNTSNLIVVDGGAELTIEGGNFIQGGGAGGYPYTNTTWNTAQVATIYVGSESTLTINGENATITQGKSNCSVLVAADGSTVNLKSGTIKGDISRKVEETDPAADIVDVHGTFNMEGGKIEGIVPANHAVVSVSSTGVLNATGGTISTTNEDTSPKNGPYGVTVWGAGQVKVSAEATIKGAEAGIQANGNGMAEGGTVIVSGGTVEGRCGIYPASQSEVNIAGGTVKGDAFGVGTFGGDFNGVTVNVSGGKVVGNTEGGKTGVGVYLPSGKMNVSDKAEITGAAGIVVRGGELNVTGGTVEATGTEEVTIGDAGHAVPAAGITVDYADYTNQKNGQLHVNISGDATIKGAASGKSIVAADNGTEMNTGSDKVENSPFEITGGTFKAGETVDNANVNKYLPEESEIDTIGKVTTTAVEQKDAEASITYNNTTTYYKTLARAIKAAEGGKTIKLEKDITLPGTGADGTGRIVITTGVVIDLNGKTMTKPAANAATKATEGMPDGIAGIKIDKNGSLTLKGIGTIKGNGTLIATFAESASLTIENSVKIEQTGSEDTKNDTAVATNGGTLTINGGTITADESGVGVFGTGKLTVNGGVINAEAFGIATNGSKTQAGAKIEIKGGTITSTGSAGVYLPNGELDMSEGDITGKAGIVSRGGKLDVTGGNVTATGTDKLVVGDAEASSKKVEVEPAAVVVDKSGTGYGNGSTTLSGGEFKAEEDKAAVVYSEDGEDKSEIAETPTLTVKGGYYSSSLKGTKLLDPSLNTEANIGDGTEYGYFTSVVEAEQQLAEDNKTAEISVIEGKAAIVAAGFLTEADNDYLNGLAETAKGAGKTWGADGIKDCVDNTFYAAFSAKEEPGAEYEVEFAKGEQEYTETVPGVTEGGIVYFTPGYQNEKGNIPATDFQGKYTVTLTKQSESTAASTATLEVYKVTYTKGEKVDGTDQTIYVGADALETALNAHPEGFTLKDGANFWNANKTATASGDAYAYTVTLSGYYASTNPTYTVTVPANPNGTVSVSPRSATAGTTITVTVTPKEGYTVDTVTATQNGTGTAVTVTKNADGTYSFTMPAGGATVKATFVEGTKPAPSAKFTDVVKDAWYVDAIDYVVEKGLMGGTGETTFAPNDQTDRAMLVTILYRLDGEPAVTKSIPFSDVPAGEWYSDAINWAAANEIVGGYGDGTFRPDRDLTREEAATILYRYATYKKYDVTTTAELTAYTDAASVQSYATAPMSWAVGTELINGTTETTLAPSGGAIRAQIATILMRFCENIVK